MTVTVKTITEATDVELEMPFALPSPFASAAPPQAPLGDVVKPLDMPVEKPPPPSIWQVFVQSDNVSQQLKNLIYNKVLGQQSHTDELKEETLRRRRGQLEDNVEVVCRLWLKKLLPWELLTTDVISMMVDAYDPPSQGAIYSVLKRWADQNLATIGIKPMRFVGFSERVLDRGIAVEKHRQGREADRRSKGFF